MLSERPGLFVKAMLLSCVAVWGVTSGLACERQPAPQRASSAKTAKPVEPAAPKASPSAAQSAATTPAGGPANPATSAPSTAAPKDLRNGVMAYYFHRTLRCPTCLSIEKQAKEAIESGFAGEMANGLLGWRAVNIETPGDEHFQQDFQIERQTLMFVKLRDGQAARSTKLERVWELVEDPAAFESYVRNEMQAFLGGV